MRNSFVTDTNTIANGILNYYASTAGEDKILFFTDYLNIVQGFNGSFRDFLVANRILTYDYCH